MPNRFKQEDNLSQMLPGETDNVTAEGSAEASIPSEAYGMLKQRKELYKVGLQNIFNDYQQNIATLSQVKQQSIEDAYYLREMSKKYLGEYASNVGIGDVSGNLLDIYGNYQSNLNDIRQSYGELKVGLEQQYNQQRMALMSEKMMTKYQMDVQKLRGQEQQVFYDSIAGNYDPSMNEQEFLKEQLEKGNISPEFFNQTSMTFMSQNEEDLFNHLSQGFFGGFDTAQEYLDSYEGRISQVGYQRLSVFAEGQKQLIEASTLHNIMDPDNKDFYVGDDYDFNLMTYDGTVGSGSIGFQDATGSRYFTNQRPFDQDEHYSVNENPMDVYNRMRNENPEQFGPLPEINDIITVNATHNESEESRNVRYMYDGATWRRLLPETDPSSNPELMMNWFIPEDLKSGTKWRMLWNKDKAGGTIPGNRSNFEITNYHARALQNPIGWFPDFFSGIESNYYKGPSIEINGVLYELDINPIKAGFKNDSFSVSNSSLDSTHSTVLDLFKKVHGLDDNKIREHSFVYHNGEMYYHREGEIYHARRAN